MNTVLNRTHTILTDVDVESFKLFKAKVGGQFKESLGAFLNTTLDSLKSIKPNTTAYGAIDAATRRAKPYLDMGDVIVNVPDGMDCSYLELLVKIEDIQNRLIELDKHADQLSSNLDRMLTGDGLKAKHSPVTGEAKQVNIGVEAVRSIFAEAFSGRDDSGRLPYTTVVGKHSDWENITSRLVVIRSQLAKVVDLEALTKRTYSVVDAVSDYAEHNDVEKARIRDVVDSAYGIASYVEMQVLLIHKFEQIDACVRDTLVAIKK